MTPLAAGPGDVLWIPENTSLHYEGDGATVFYALSPVDWKAIAAAKRGEGQ